MSENNRAYTLSDADIRVFGYMVFRTLPKDLEEFSNFDNSINQHSVDKIIMALEQFSTIVTNPYADAGRMQRLEIVRECMEECANLQKDILHFAKKCFDNNSIVLKHFGKGRFSKLKDNHGKLIIFMRSYSDTVHKYRIDLQNAGCLESTIERATAIYHELLEKINDLEAYKKEKELTTQKRVEAYNSLYYALKPINDIAKIIYKDNPAMMAFYVLP